jgi:hypothetical protein
MKELTRDSATDAFRFWAFVEQLKGRVVDPLDECGRVDVVAKYKALLYADIYRAPAEGAGKGDGLSPTEQQLIAMERRLENARATILDLEAVARTVDWADLQLDGPDMLAAVKAVYQVQPDVPADHVEIRRRAAAYAERAPMHISTVYRKLRKARVKWGEERGLRVFELVEVY